MKGLELSEKYFYECGLPVIHENFGDIEEYLAFGLSGSGSECFGFDDEISQDHDFGPGFCIFIPDDIIDSRTEFRLERAYAHLPKEFCGFERQKISPVGGNRQGVIHISDFFRNKCGSEDGSLTATQWLSIPEKSLCEAVNGKIFIDNLGLVTQIREKLSFYPTDIFLKKLAGYTLTMAQAGQYNYNRSIKRGDTAAAQMSAVEFVNAAIHSAYLLSGKYTPYYKWSLSQLENLTDFADLTNHLEFLISSDNTPDTAEVKSDVIEEIAMKFISAFQKRGITDAICGDLEKHAYSINDRVNDSNIRNMSIFAGV